MSNRFYVYKTDDNKYISIKENRKQGTIDLSKRKSLDNAAYWNGISSAKTWKSKVLHKYPNSVLTEVKFTLVDPN